MKEKGDEIIAVIAIPKKLKIKILNAETTLFPYFENSYSTGAACYYDLELNSHPFALCNICLHSEVNTDLNILSERRSTEVRLFFKNLNEFNKKKHPAIIAGSILESPFSLPYLEIMKTIQDNYIDINSNKQYFTYYYQSTSSTYDYIFISHRFKQKMFYIPPSDSYCKILTSLHVPLMTIIDIAPNKEINNINTNTCISKSANATPINSFNNNIELSTPYRISYTFPQQNIQQFQYQQIQPSQQQKYQLPPPPPPPIPPPPPPPQQQQQQQYHYNS